MTWPTQDSAGWGDFEPKTGRLQAGAWHLAVRDGSATGGAAEGGAGQGGGGGGGAEGDLPLQIWFGGSEEGLICCPRLGWSLKQRMMDIFN